MPSAPIDKHIQFTAGDDCKAADGRALAWTSATWPDLTGSTLTLVIGHDQYNLFGNSPVTFTAPAAVVAASGAQTVSMDLTSAQTDQLSAGEFDYTLTAKLADGDTVTLAAGWVSVFAPPTALPMYPPAV